MNFMSYVVEVSRGWDEPNARDMGRMTSQPNTKAEMYILNDGINMKVKITAMERRLEKLEMKNMQEVQAISQTPLLPMPCSICRSYEHMVDECPTIPTEREMFGDCNTYNSNWRDHPKFSWKPQPPQYKQHVQALPQASSLEQAMVNLSKFMGDLVGAQKSINAQLNQRIDSVESSLIKRMDEVQKVINFVDYSLNQGATAGHESVETPIGHESLPDMCDRHFEIVFFRYLMSKSPNQSNSEDFSSKDERLGSSSLGVKKAGWSMKNRIGFGGQVTYREGCMAIPNGKGMTHSALSWTKCIRFCQCFLKLVFKLGSILY
uniref:Uncharacterized protein n=1 Tax=Vitis vinifera TaxID=29760 RepID=A5BL80_VITVI|nr:hypothetical protein VITISV_013144 [Vitis vinifera]